MQYIYLNDYKHFAKELPACVKNELLTSSRELLRCFLKLSCVNKYGGIASEADIELKRPIGDIRSRKAVFIRQGSDLFHFFAGQKSLSIYQKLLSLFNDPNLTYKKFITMSEKMILEFVKGDNDNSILFYDHNNDIIEYAYE